MFEDLSKKYQISKSWIADQIGVSRQYFQFALSRGLTPQEVQAIERIIAKKALELKLRAKDLEKFQIPEKFKQKKNLLN